MDASKALLHSSSTCSSLLSPHPVPMYEYPNDTNRVVITLTPVMAEALLSGTVLTTLCHPKALSPTPINTYEYWQRPAIIIIASQVARVRLCSGNFGNKQVQTCLCACLFPLSPFRKTCKLILLAFSSITQMANISESCMVTPDRPEPNTGDWSRTNKQKRYWSRKVLDM